MNTLFYVGLVVMAVGQLWCAKAAFSHGPLVGVVVLLVPFASLVLAFKYWEEARAALILNVIGLLVVAAAGISLQVNRNPPAAPATTEQQQRDGGDAPPTAGSGGGPGAAATTASPFEWTSVSFDGKAVLKEVLSSARSCNLTCSVGDKEVWKATVDCIATGRDFRFVAVDCERVVVVHNVRVDGTDWKTIDAATVFKRSKKAYDVGAVTVVKDPRRVMTAPTWLQGVLGGAGEPPRYSKDGTTVEIDCVDGKHSQIPLIAAEEPPAAEEQAPAPPPKKKKRKH